MNSPRSQFPLWLFIATDLALIGAAAVIAAQAPRPFSQATIIWTVACIVLGVIVGLVPIIWHFERKKNEALDDRQRALEALARTVSSSAEQISIATGGLHEIAEVAQKNLRQADQLPHRLQEKIAEFQAQLAQANDTEKEELERELLALRTSETDRLEAVSQRIAKTSAEWVKLEAATAQHLTGVNDGLARLTKGTSDSITKAHAAAEQALSQARIEAARSLSEASNQAVKAIENARAAALNELSGQLTVLLAQVAHDAATQLSARLASSTADLEAQLTRLAANRAALPPAAAPTPAAAAPQVEVKTSDVAPDRETATATFAPAPIEPIPAAKEADAPAPVVVAASESPREPSEAAAEPTSVAPVIKRSRKPRREEAPVASAPAIEPVSGEANVTAAAPALSPAAEPTTQSAPAIPQTDVAVQAAAAPATTVVASEVLSGPSSPVDSTAAAPVQTTIEPPPAATGNETSTAASAPEIVVPPVVIAPSAAEPDPELVKAAIPRKRPAKKAAEDDFPSLDLGLDDGDFGQGRRGGAGGITDRVLSSDGATRLIITAYIGIGNRLYIRGDGPGLSWERGVPLEFVSIGKWRWQTNDATQPVQFKIYKNDELECPSLGKLVIDPGYQQEATAGF